MVGSGGVTKDGSWGATLMTKRALVCEAQCCRLRIVSGMRESVVDRPKIMCEASTGAVMGAIFAVTLMVVCCDVEMSRARAAADLTVSSRCTVVKAGMSPPRFCAMGIDRSSAVSLKYMSMKATSTSLANPLMPKSSCCGEGALNIDDAECIEAGEP